MSATDSYYHILRMRDELMAQNKKIDNIAEQLEAQTKLQAGIFKQLYLLCQIVAAPDASLKGSFSRESDEVFLNTSIPREKPPEANYDSILKRYTDETGEVVYFSESNDKFIKWMLRNIKNHVKEESEHENSRLEI